MNSFVGKMYSLAGILMLPFAICQGVRDKPNIIIVQADDLHFLEYWEGTHVHFDNSQRVYLPKASSIPNIEYLRRNGLQMKQAHTASPMCGTSRYSTITGRYPSRSAWGRWWDFDNDVREVTIPAVKLADTAGTGVPRGRDCTRNNIAQVFQGAGYRTGMVGKWHLGEWTNDLGYRQLQESVRNCGFDVSEAVYPHNMAGDWVRRYGYEISHNMEHVAAEAIDFIQGSVRRDENFFLYLNPTVPHGSNDVSDTLRYGDCRQSVGGWIQTPDIPRGKYSQTIRGDCGSYRQTVLTRATSWSDKELGTIWLDDAMGWIIKELEYHGILNNTLILFQQDQGQEGKGTLYEQGTHIAQFVHYPDKYLPGSTFDGLVSTIDIGPTVLDIAGINPTYHMDGKSWATAVASNHQPTMESWRNRCIFFELQHDRAVQCGCDIYMRLSTTRESWTRSLHLLQNRLDWSSFPEPNWGRNQLYNMCHNGDFIYSPHAPNPQRNGRRLLNSNKDKVDQLSALVDCHLGKTHPQRVPDYDMECSLETVQVCQDVDWFELPHWPGHYDVANGLPIGPLVDADPLEMNAQ
eukprot:CAMPEP_0172471286 /NCGR_PEP_ID=MMETSP1065-20121228/67739_1 /TAXON_ID=265537 /ORGANISM="Amphiprora paludosa, Strain CCMP125" /LENGTH=574 /DNA_ID=CAMNT_0013229381 /DNA_START=20 /DNA_END=1745 /DNA_ORIENTATION=+